MTVIFDNGQGLRVERNENGLLYVGALADLVHALACEVQKQTETISAFNAALERSEFDISPCISCGDPVVCVPDGLPLCSICAAKAETSNAQAGGEGK